MRKAITGALVTASAAALALGLTATPALAASSYNVTGARADGTAEGASTDTQLEVPRSGAVLTCVLSEVGATNLTNGTNKPGAGIASISSSTWTSCTGPLGIEFDVTHGGTWLLNATGDTAAGVTPGSITNVVADINGATCNARFTGSVAGSYNNNNGVLSVNSGLTLTASNVSGCFDLIRNGDTARFTGNYNITPNTIDLVSNP